MQRGGMATYTLFHPDQELIGAVLITYRASINFENYSDLYERLGLGSVEVDKWYSGQVVIDLINTIAERTSAMMDFVSIGTAMGMYTPASEVSSYLDFGTVVTSLDSGYQAMTRGTDVGWFRGGVIAPQHVKVDYRVPWPDDLEYGFVYGLAKRFLPPLTKFTAVYDPAVLRRELGGEYTSVHVRWTLPDTP